jgi:apolipoprotein N-acyltransferase
MKEPTMTFGLFIRGFILGLITWIPMLVFAIVVPVIGWIMIPVAIVWPLGMPYAMLSKKKKEWRKSYDN